MTAAHKRALTITTKTLLAMKEFEFDEFLLRIHTNRNQNRIGALLRDVYSDAIEEELRRLPKVMAKIYGRPSETQTRYHRTPMVVRLRRRKKAV